MSSQVGKKTDTTNIPTERRSDIKGKESGAEIRDETPGVQNQTQQQTQMPSQTQQQQGTTTQGQVSQQQPQQQEFKPFNYSLHYSSSSTERNGQREMKERFEMRNPEVEMVAEKKPGAEDLYDVQINKKTGDKQAINQQLPGSQVRNQIDQYWKDMSQRMEQSFKGLGIEFEPIKPLLGLESFTPQLSIGQGPTQQQGAIEQQQPQQQQGQLQPQQQQQQQGQLSTQQGMGSQLSRRDYFQDPFRLMEDFDRDFRRMEDEMRRMRDSMFRSFRDMDRFDRRFFW